MFWYRLLISLGIFLTLVSTSLISIAVYAILSCQIDENKIKAFLTCGLFIFLIAILTLVVGLMKRYSMLKLLESKNDVDLNMWLEKTDSLNRFKCSYSEKIDNKTRRWIPGHLLLTKTHLYGLTERKDRKKGTVEITVKMKLSSIVRIACKTSCPEIISFTCGKKIEKKKSINPEISGSVYNLSKREIKSIILPDEKLPEEEYEIESKEWFHIPQYSGHAAGAVKLQVLKLLNISDWNGNKLDDKSHRIDFC